MNLLFSCIGRRGYVVEWFREHLSPGDRIIGTSNTELTPGFHACDLAVLMPDVGSEAYVSALLELCRVERIDALLSFLDQDVDCIARNRHRLEALGVVPVVPEARVSEISFDKWQSHCFLREAGLRTPPTHLNLDDVLEAITNGALSFPLVVKERWGLASRHLHFAANEAQLRAFFSLAPDLIIQERLGGSEYSLDVLNDFQGRVLSVIVKRKLIMRAGETDQACSVHHPEALALGERLGTALGHFGPLDVDLFIDGEEISVLDLNPRFGGGYAVSQLAGADFPRKILALIRGEAVEPDIGEYKAGVYMMKDYRILPAYAGELTDLREERGPR